MKRPISFLLILIVLIVVDPSHLVRGEGVTSASAQGATYSVTANGTSAYVIGGQNNPSLTLNQGSTYIFNVNASGHPFYIKTAAVTGTGSQYTQGVTGNGVTNGQLTFVVPMTAPATLYYHCGNHAAMGAMLNIIGPVGVDGTIPSMAWLGRAVPNPVREGASFRVGLPRDTKIDVTLYDARGRRVRTLWKGPMTAGEHSMAWDGRDDSRRLAPSGAYFYRLRVDGRTLTGRLLVTR